MINHEFIKRLAKYILMALILYFIANYGPAKDNVLTALLGSAIFAILDTVFPTMYCNIVDKY